MRYELLLQAEAGVPYDPSRVDAALATRGAVEKNGVRTWRLESVEVEVRPLVEGGRLIATELRLPLSAKLDGVRELVVEGCELAAEAGVKLFDPQLAKVLTPADEGLVSDQFLRNARWAGEYLGVSEAVDQSFAPVETGLKPGTKVMLGVIGFIVVLYLLVDRFL